MVYIKVARGMKGQPTTEERTVRDLVAAWLIGKLGEADSRRFTLSIQRCEAPSTPLTEAVRLSSHLLEDGAVKLVIRVDTQYYGCLLQLPGKAGERQEVYGCLNGIGPPATAATVQHPEPVATASAPRAQGAETKASETQSKPAQRATVESKPAVSQARADLILERHDRGNRETTLHTGDGGHNKRLVIRRSADGEMITFIRNLKFSEQAVRAESLSALERIGVLIEERILYPLNRTGQYAVAVTERRFRFETRREPCLLVQGAPEPFIQILIRDKDTYLLCKMQLANKEMAAELQAACSRVIPSVQIEAPRAAMPAPVKFNGASAAEGTEALTRRLQSFGLLDFRVELTEAVLPGAMQKGDFAVDGTLQIRIPVRQHCPDGKFRRVWITVSSYELACVIRHLLSR